MSNKRKEEKSGLALRISGTLAISHLITTFSNATHLRCATRTREDGNTKHDNHQMTYQMTIKVLYAETFMTEFEMLPIPL